MARRSWWASLLAAALLPALPMAAGAVEIVAHRGASYDAPENTLPAIQLGFEQGADAVEIDIYLTRDGRIVALHDATTKRTAGVNRPVAEQTLAELKKLDAGRWKGERWAGVEIPTLEEALAAVPPGKRLVIEIKAGAEILPELERVVEASGKGEQTAVIGFSYPVIRAAQKRLPDIPMYWLYGFSAGERLLNGRPSHEDLIRKAEEAGLAGLDVNYRGDFDREFVQKLERSGLKLWVYTVNDPAEAKRLAEMGVDAITTDRPALLRQHLEQ